MAKILTQNAWVREFQLRKQGVGERFAVVGAKRHPWQFARAVRVRRRPKPLMANFSIYDFLVDSLKKTSWVPFCAHGSGVAAAGRLR